MNELRDKLAQTLFFASHPQGVYTGEEHIQQHGRWLRLADALLPVVEAALAEQREAFARALDAASESRPNLQATRRWHLQLAAKIVRDFGKDTL